MVNEVIRELKPSSDRIKFLIHDIPTSFGDYALLSQVWLNLISNAIKYSSKKGSPVIEIGSFSNQGEDGFCIKDNGAGFDMKYADKLFGVFQRLHGMKDFDGTGIGLALVKRIVNKHGGRVWAHGEPGVGATFYFTLPNL
ncbi:sensor histidine kinase [Chryseosolibacter indicus]|uniref:histidine kinase n=1 Tax=Chryseosolibacter indicus TaxID=2782351 RepID=A0ABS5VSF0_9BACT|nr:ATP-binding protein [Chryseosolibacter indicus]MBT1703799.1 hypothetical protein [Chryseosolibacter indicus]